MHIYPHIEFDNVNHPKIIDGYLFKKHDICDCARKKCVDFYQKNSNQSGIIQCPYGFNSYFFIDDYENEIILTSLRIANFFDRKKQNREIQFFLQ